ncbi:hypothetical protein ABTK78_20530, partial [Acinetobacter baumannii]
MKGRAEAAFAGLAPSGAPPGGGPGVSPGLQPPAPFPVGNLVDRGAGACGLGVSLLLPHGVR